MIENILAMLIYFTTSHTNMEAPVFYQKRIGKQMYQVIVVKMADQEAIAA